MTQISKLTTVTRRDLTAGAQSVQSNEFYDGVRAETDYSFLVFERLDLKYVDEFGVKHKAIVE